MGAVIPRVQAILNANPDLAYSRLMCPRLLDVNTSYDAFIIPAFESGRLAGLGLDLTKAPSATASAWVSYAGQAEPQIFPITIDGISHWRSRRLPLSRQLAQAAAR